MSGLDYQKIAYWRLNAGLNQKDSMNGLRELFDGDIDAIALDLNFSKDRHVVVISDNTLQRRCVEDMTLSELQERQVPTLDEVLAIWPQDLLFVANLKELDADCNVLFLRKAKNLLEESNIPMILCSESPDVVHLLREVDCDIMGIAEDNDTMKLYAKWSIPLVAIGHDLLTRQNIRKLLDADVDVWAWNLDDETEISDFAWLGLSGVCVGSNEVLS